MSKPLVVLTTLLPLAAILLYAGAPKDPPPGGHGVLARGRMQTVPRAWVPPIKSERWECIVVHHSATPMGGAARFARAHRTRGFGLPQMCWWYVIAALCWGGFEAYSP